MRATQSCFYSRDCFTLKPPNMIQFLRCFVTLIIRLLEGLCRDFQQDWLREAAVSPQLKQGVLAAMKDDKSPCNVGQRLLPVGP